MITREEHKIVSEYIVSIIDWERIYKDTALESRINYSKETIIGHIRKLVLSYPDHFDISIKGRIEFGTVVFRIYFGMLNNYIFLISDENFNYRVNGWFLTEDRLLKAVNTHRNKDKYIVIFDYKQYLRNNKINKICQTLTQTTNSVLE